MFVMNDEIITRHDNDLFARVQNRRLENRFVCNSLTDQALRNETRVEIQSSQAIT